jgi:hypothetical protein
MSFFLDMFLARMPQVFRFRSGLVHLESHLWRIRDRGDDIVLSQTRLCYKISSDIWLCVVFLFRFLSATFFVLELTFLQIALC